MAKGKAYLSDGALNQISDFTVAFLDALGT